MPVELSNQDKFKVLAKVFSPSSPITSKSSFYGRYDQLSKVESAVSERGQHIVMFGERGVGKTSLTNVIEEKHPNMHTVKITCTRDDTFEGLWEDIIKNLLYAIQFDVQKRDLAVLKYIQTIFREKNTDIQDIIFTIQKLKTPLLMVLDEFDVIKKPKTLIRFADVMKAFSDNLPQTTLMIVGIAENIVDLIGEHPSLERCLCQVYIPRMNHQELRDVIDSGLFKLKLSMDKRVKEDIIVFSQGFPHYTHLLAKFSVLNAIKKRYSTIVRSNFDNAINKAIENAYQSTRVSYQKAVFSNKEISPYKAVVQSCALATEDEHGTFRASDLLHPMKAITKKPVTLKSFTYHLSKLHTESKGALLHKVSHNNQTRYRFKNPILKAYIMLKLYESGFLKNNVKFSRA